MKAKDATDVIRDYINEKNVEGVLGSLGCVSRENAAQYMSLLKKDELVRALNMIEASWAVELIWFTDEKLYNKVIAEVPAIKNYKKP